MADKVVVLWPSGATDTLTDVAVDRFYCVEEGMGIVPGLKIRPIAAGGPDAPKSSGVRKK
jgi:hypothetical protein